MSGSRSHAQINVRLPNTEIVQTTAGRVLLSQALPKGSEFFGLIKYSKRSDLTKLVEKVYYRFGREKTVECLDKYWKTWLLSFYCGRGISFSIKDLVVPQKKDVIIRKADQEEQVKLYTDGIITNGERYNKILSLWYNATADVAAEMYKESCWKIKEAFFNKKR